MTTNPRMIASNDIEGWPEMAANALATEIDDAISKRGICHLMLTGGNTASRLYKYWAESSFPVNQIEFWFGDERCVPPDDPESNHALFVNMMFQGAIPQEVRVNRMEAERPDRESAAKEYAERLPDTIDILLLGMGPDGHIASLFPGSSLLKSDAASVVSVTGPKPPFDRLTITPQVIKQARSVFLLATGKEKGAVLAEALKEPENVSVLPVRLTLGGTWLLDNEAQQELQNNSPSL